MADGATLIAPETVWFAHDTVLGRDVLIEPNVFFGPGVSVANNVKIRANSHIEGAQIASGCEVGPFARLRPGTVLEEKAKIGNFVEVKKARLRQRRQGQPPDLSGRRRCWRRREHRRGHDHLQL